VIANANVQSLKGQVAQLQQERSRIAERYGEKTSRFHQGQRQPRQRRQAAPRRNPQGRSERQERIRAGDRAGAQPELVVERSQGRGERPGRKGVDYSVLERNAESNQRIYDQLITRQNELRVVANSRTNNVRVVDRATVPGATVYA
jgi:uncharacterized protein involved in exopolysaccharide biosynthesis